ncbi:MAG: HD domain-containing protein [Actinomycetota bacterium]
MSAADSAREARHLVQRFFGSLRPARLSGADEAWALDRLTPAERNLWLRQDRRDRAHSIAVARLTIELLGGEADDRVVVAALCHDVGKGVAGVGVIGRVIATLLDPMVSDARAERWSWRSDLLGRIGMYLRYPGLGANLLSEGGADPMVVAWAREHHLPPEDWTIDRSTAEALRLADDSATMLGS